ncbi:hypothetical protein NSK_001010 [Nannochloropsis salina CCMP1776]|uniref:Pyrroline-5-carboxylate reductase n=1 Tax=Nannochloropsis salina CCMP1776 TaxID=1027361 RepID=A0A4D9D8B8_9STRA|nr:hypothetical protein NSK_001010 [Nannochloropsis salina CCMP1776]|eukprot:TFJ87660.1 hypothetical protein NSK_001010 [Nannochloropsis salina CCMP1776]
MSATVRWIHRSQAALSHDDSKPDPVANAEGFDFNRIGLVGGGKMSEAIIEGFVTEKLIQPGKISVYDVSRKRLDYLMKTFGVQASSSLAATCKDSDLVIIAVKPQNLTQKLWAQLRANLDPKSVVLSIVAGIPMSNFVESTGNKRVVRTMPNTPATIQQGMTVWACTDHVSVSQRNSVAKFLSSLGEQHFVHDEQYLDMATAVSGSGPGYVLLILEALIDAAVHLGFARNVASKLVLQTVSGTTTLAMKSGLHPAILRNSVTSPGGTTASALYVLEQGRFRTVLADSFWSAYRRSLELGHMDSNVGPGRSRHDAHETDSHKK